MKIKIKCVIEVNDDVFPYSDEFPDEKEWFDGIMNDKKNTRIILYSNDIGDGIGETDIFKYEIIKNKQQ